MNVNKNSEEEVLEAQIEHLRAEIKELQHQQWNHNKNMTFNFRGQMQDAL